MADISAWGWDWVKKAHIDQLEFKTGLAGEQQLFTLMASVANGPDEKVMVGKFEDHVKRVGGVRLVLRMLDEDAQSFFPVTEVKAPKVMGKWKFRGVRKITGEGGLAHSAIGLFSTHKISPVEAFMPNYPAVEQRLKFLTDYQVAMELLPKKAKRLDEPVEDSKKGIVQVTGQKKEFTATVKGTVAELGYSYVLIDAGMPVFIEKRNFQNLKLEDPVEAEGALYAYPEP